MLLLSCDGYVRTTLAHLKTHTLSHLVSGLDEDGPLLCADGATPTAITGYAEFVAEGPPALTIGWDWQMTVTDGAIGLNRVSEPRSNIMLLGDDGADLGPRASAILLQSLVDAFRWQDEVIGFVNLRYAK
ncbi:DUF4902 domain-containing protein [Massilia atriviolacea]|uniref:DUF4902 domain-containing protein n=1 Tax=Massilia atriviolacea TaxID=2495579 RepID=A0A430HC80_9BURK|nr:DUF4902 domain-containing protein [Massilia atriviolacea]RSZ55130.1 DUF4902 domain-containing protein [Massilia atriviolacea]